MKPRALSAALLCLLCALCVQAKDLPSQVVLWPESGTPVLRFTFGKFKEIGSMGNQRTYMTDTTAENLWSKAISNANFSLYLFDKNKARIGEGFVTLTSVGAGETVKFQTTIGASGAPVSVSLVAQYLPPELRPAQPPRTVSITVNSVPQGALLKLDGSETGTTPKMVQVGIGKHMLEFSKEGFSTGHFPLEIGPNDVSGGSVSYELGTSAHDTVEMRDGSVLNGDLESVSATEIVMRIGGSLQHFSRNQVKRILLVERDMPGQ
jgi:PEGA domain-containing protein